MIICKATFHGRTQYDTESNTLSTGDSHKWRDSKNIQY